MQAVSYSEARENLKSMIDKVVADRAPLAIAVDGRHLAPGCRRRRGTRADPAVKLVFDREAWAEYLSCQAQDARIVERINLLIGDCMRHPFTGVGKPEPLKRNLAGWWSRRINHERRLVYRIRGVDEADAGNTILPHALLKRSAAFEDRTWSVACCRSGQSTWFAV